MPIYKFNGDVYDIPQEKQAEFESQFPDASISYTAGADQYDIPVSKREDFLKDFPDAQLYTLETQPASNNHVEDNVEMEDFPMFDDEPNAPLGEPEAERGFAAGARESWKGLKAGFQNLWGETANVFTGSSQDSINALNELNDMVRQGKDVAAETEDAWTDFGRELRTGTMEFLPGWMIKGWKDRVADKAEKQKVLSDIRDVLGETGGDVDKARTLLEQRAQDQSYGDLQMEKAAEKFADIKPTEGFGAWVGSNAVQMVPSASALIVGAVTKSPAAAKAIGMIGMGGMTASTAGTSMYEAREAGASDSKTWKVGVTDGMIEYLTEKLPFDRYTSRIMGKVKSEVAQDLFSALRTNKATRTELENLLIKANERLGGKLFSKKNLKDYVADMLAEGASEFSAEALQTMTSMMYEEPENYPTINEILTNGWEGAKAGFFMGAVLGGASKTMEHSQNRQRRMDKGSVDIALVDMGNGEKDVAEVVEYDAKSNTAVILRDGALESVSGSAISDGYRFSFDEFEKARLRQMEDEAIVSGNVNDGQIQGLEDNIARDIDEIKALAPEMTESEISAVLQSEMAVDPDTPLGEAVAKYQEDVARHGELVAVKREADAAKKEAIRTEIETAVGQRFWVQESGEDDGSGIVPVSETVEEVVYADGRVGYVVGSDESGNLTMVYTDGTKGFSSRAEIAEKENSGEILSNTVMGLDDYLAVKMDIDEVTREKVRMQEEHALSVEEMIANHPQGSVINVGTEEAKIEVPIIAPPTTDGVIVQMPDGTTPMLTWEDVAHAEKKEIAPKTDAQINQSIVDEYRVAYTPVNPIEAAVPTQQKEEQVKMTSPANPLPLKADGTVDQTALWNKEPERWAQWNDEQRQDGGANSLAYVSGAIAKEQAKIAELQAAYGAEADFDARDVIEKEIADTQARVGRLAAIQQGYLAQPAVADAVQNVQPEPQTEEEKAKAEEQRRQPLRERAKELSNKLGVKVNIAEGISDVKEAMAREEILRAEVSGGKQTVAGWFNPTTGEVTIYLPHAKDTTDVEQTFVHEVVAHKGIRGLLGEEGFNVLCDAVWDMMTEAERAKYMTYPGVNGDKRAAADEYIAHYAETMNLEESKPVWDRIMDLIMRILNSMGVNLEMTKDQLSDIIVASYQKLVKEAEVNAESEVVQEEAQTTPIVSEEQLNAPNSGEAQQIIAADGEVLADTDGKGGMRFSIRTWEEGGRDYLAAWLANDTTLTEEEKADILARMDEFYKNALLYSDTYAPFGTWSDAGVRYDNNGNPLMSVIKANGDYAMNLNFSLVCKKRRPLNRLLRTLVNRNAFATYTLRERELAEINWILQEHGFEVACALCFVDSKRYRVTGVADVFAALYNRLVKSLAPEGVQIAHFNYNNNPNVEVVENGLDTISDDQLNWNRFDRLLSAYKKGSVEYKVAQYLREHPEARKLVDATDFIEAEGFESVKENNPDLLKFYNMKKGTGGPKASFGDVQYLNDILKKEKSFDAEKAYAVGGVRLQSFSDFVPHMYFDYMQLFAELAAKKLPLHAYTKEVLFAKIFGLTGAKINMSLVPAVVEGGIAPGLDAEGNYAWADPVTDAEGNVIQQGQSFPYDEAMAIQQAEGYSKNCGVIAVGISDAHIEKMLDDPNIPFIIPYHKSSLNAIVARMTNIDQYKDYTNVQNTRKASGSKLDKGTKDFNFNEHLHGLGESGTPQQAAQAYLDWCRENKFIPKFSQFAYHPNYYKLLQDFNTIDLVTGEYAPQGAVTMTFPTEQSAFGNVETLIQQGLQEDAELEEKMEQEIDGIADQVLARLEEISKEPKMSEKQQAKKMAELADERMAKIKAKAQGPIDLIEEAKKAVARDEAKKNKKAKKSDIRFRITPEQDKAYMDAVEAGDMDTAQRMVDETADRVMKNSKVRDSQGKLIRVTHYSPNEFTTFDPQKIGSSTDWGVFGRGFYFSNKDHRLYGKNRYEGYLNLENPFIINGAEEAYAYKEAIADFAGVQYYEVGKKETDDYTDYLISQGYDGVIYNDTFSGFNEYVAFYPYQFKLADVVDVETKDDNGNVIPLSERFNPENEDIRFRMRTEEEDAMEFQESVLEEFKQEYRLPAPTTVVDVYDRDAVANSLGYAPEKFTDAQYDFIMKGYQEGGASIFDPETKRIAIFAKETLDESWKMYDSTFHENTHFLVAEHPDLLELGEWLWQNSEPLMRKTIKEHILANDTYKGYETDEMLSGYTGVIMSTGKADVAYSKTPEELRKHWDLIFNAFGYERKTEDNLRRRGTGDNSGRVESSGNRADASAEQKHANETAQRALTAEERRVINEYFPGAFPDPIDQARLDVEQNPTDAQKEAGNYKKGHLRLDGYNITIENPKGSVRRGTDSKGNAWENTLNNDYGYIRGTEGVDGDHIDVYLSDNPTEGNVFVIDQVNPETREFDEHKVMYGFNSAEEAREAYLANFSEGWNGLGTITEVSKDEFKKWIESSHRKTKPFSEYKSVRANEMQATDESELRYRVVSDQETLDRLNSEPTIKVYRAMQLIDGKLYPPMSAKVDGELRQPIELGQWEEAEERPDLVDEKGRFKLDKGNKTSLKARYNPYFHTSPTPLNDQFSSAQTRPELVTVEVEVPESELTSGYKAEKAKDSVGKLEWKAGVVQSKLSGTRTVILSRWDKPVRIVPDSEVADVIVDMFEGKDISMPSNVVTPSLRAELEKRGVPFVETDNQGNPVEEVSFRVTGTPTDEVVANGLQLTPAQTAEVAANIFAALPEANRKKITEGLNGNILGLQDAILQIPTSLATKENWNDEDRQMANVVAEEMTKMAGEMTRPFSAPEALWLLYNNLNKDTDLISQASRALVQRNLGFDAETLAKQEQAKEGVRFRTVGDATSNAQASLYNKGAVNVWTRLKETFVDMQAAVEELVEAIEKRTGVITQGFENVLLALNQQSSKGLAAMESYTQKFLNPMFDEIRRIMNETDFKYEDIVRYVILKHGLERNKKLAQRDAKAHYQEIYDDIISKISGMTAAQKRTYLTNAQLKEADAKAELATLKAVDMSAMTDEEKREHKKKLAVARKAVEEAEEHLKRAQKIASMSEQEAKDELDKVFEKIENGTDSVYKEMRENDYSGISSMFYDQLGVDRKNFSTEEQYQAALMEAKKDKYSSLADVEAAAEAEVRVFEGLVDTKELWKRINACTKETLRQQYEANMISKDQYENLRNMFEYYVPLRGFKDNTAEDMYTYYRKPNSTGYTKPILGAEGRKTEAESPFGWIASMAGSAIASNVKNEAKLALYYFVSNRPNNGIATISRTWFVDSGEVDERGKKIFKPAYPPFSEDLSSDEAKARYESWQENMRELQKKGQAYEAGQRLNLGNAVVNISDANKPEHIVNVKVGGKDYTIIINGNPRAAQAINGDLNIEGTSQDYSEFFGPLLRWMSSVNTSYNPEFWITNMMRDMAFTMMAVNIKEDPAYRRKFSKNYLKAFRVVSLVAKNENGTIGDSYLEEQYKDFVKYGGVTGYTQIKDSETWEKEIENYLSSNDPESIKSGKVMRGMKTAFHAAHRFGESLEQVSRFAAFLTARETGKSINEAINDAKEITVNFNRKGSGKMITLEEAKYLTDKNGQRLSKPEQWMVVGLSSIAPLGRKTIMFFNAAIQGLNATYKLMKKNPKRFTGWALGYAAIGMMNALLHAMMDDDDDYLDIPQYERRNSLMIGGNGAYFKWALPQESRAFYALGDLAVETIMGRNPHQNVVGEALKIGTEILPVNPSEGWKAFMPSIAIPLIELALNEDYKGSPIYNDQKWLSEEEKERTAKWSKAYQGTGWMYVKIAQGLNFVTGGDEHDAGLINLQPEKMEHLVQSAFGGTIRTADKFINTISAVIDPEEPWTVRQTPFLNRFLTINDERFKNVHVNDVFDYYKADAEHALTLEKQYIKDRDMDSLTKLRSSDEYQWAKIYGKYKKPLKAIQEKIKVADGTSEKKELMKQQDELKKKMIKEISEL